MGAVACGACRAVAAMEKQRNPNFIYIKSDLLVQEVAVSKKTGWVFCEDGVKYSPDELEVIRRSNGVLDMATHQIKRILGGEIVSCEQKSSDKEKPDGNKSSSDKVPSVNEAGSKNENELFDIY